ncbi:aldehyde dehydrogenase family protein [Neobacillus sp. BF23-41]
MVNFVESQLKKMIAVTNPVTGEFVSEIPECSADEVQQAIASAEIAQ